MPKCAVKECKNNTLKVQKIDGISYFHFPQNEIQRDKWRCIIAQNRKNEFYKPNDSSVICSIHFCKDDMYLTKKGFKRIKKRSLPILKQDESQTEVRQTLNMTENLLSPKTINIKEESSLRVCKSRDLEAPNMQIPSSSTSLSPCSILETPREVMLQKQLTECKRRLSIKTKTVKNLRKVNNRLKKKNATLKNIIAALRKKKGLDVSILNKLSNHIEVQDTFNSIFLKNVKNKKRPFTKFPPGARKFALSLHLYSPEAYRYIRKIFHNCLPHTNTLLQWYKSINAKPGNTN